MVADVADEAETARIAPLGGTAHRAGRSLDLLLFRS
jgi:hypothetical protein